MEGKKKQPRNLSFRLKSWDHTVLAGKGEEKEGGNMKKKHKKKTIEGGGGEGD